MPQVAVELPHHRYVVHVEPGALASLGERVREVAPHGRCALVADEQVFRLHGEAARGALEGAGYDVLCVAIPLGEARKNLATVQAVHEQLLDARLERRSPVVAFGGGVAGDTAGFAAATYLRGVPYIQCPTTLLAMVDSSVGGKTGVNVPQGKNLVGAFYQPHAVVADPELLSTLPLRELSCGLAECVKHAMLGDASLFAWIRERASALLACDGPALAELVARNVAIKAGVVQQDEREHGIRAHLNLGHTFGHAIEATGGYGVVLHGEAVALGLVAASACAAEMGICDAGIVDEVRALLGALGLGVAADLADDAALDAAMRLDKKVIDAKIRFVLPEAIGKVGVRDDVPLEAVRAGWAAIRRA